MTSPCGFSYWRVSPLDGGELPVFWCVEICAEVRVADFCRRIGQLGSSPGNSLQRLESCSSSIYALGRLFVLNEADAVNTFHGVFAVYFLRDELMQLRADGHEFQLRSSSDGEYTTYAFISNKCYSSSSCSINIRWSTAARAYASVYVQLYDECCWTIGTYQ